LLGPLSDVGEHLQPERDRLMERKRVNAGTIRSVGYDQASRTLEVEFTSGSISQYANVPAEVHRRFLAAPTLISFFRDNIEEEYSTRRVR